MSTPNKALTIQLDRFKKAETLVSESLKDIEPGSVEYEMFLPIQIMLQEIRRSVLNEALISHSAEELKSAMDVFESKSCNFLNFNADQKKAV